MSFIKYMNRCIVHSPIYQLFLKRHFHLRGQQVQVDPSVILSDEESFFSKSLVCGKQLWFSSWLDVVMLSSSGQRQQKSAQTTYTNKIDTGNMPRRKMFNKDTSSIFFYYFEGNLEYSTFRMWKSSSIIQQFSPWRFRVHWLCHRDVPQKFCNTCLHNYQIC